MYFEDRNGYKYEITKWLFTDVTICGFFCGTIHNYHEWIYANLGYGNKIVSIKNIDTQQEYSLDDTVEFIKPILNHNLKKIRSATVKQFYVDSFTQKIGILTNKKLGHICLSDINKKIYKKSRKMNNNVLCAMSGGIDSTVSALLLKRQNKNVIGLTMKTWDYANSGGSKKSVGCCSLDDINDARAVCVENGIPHYVLDIREEFNNKVMNNFIDEYMNARTPNPCTLCNTHIKWGALIKRADQLNCHYIATGHYANVEVNPANGRYYITAGIDKTKDQSYVLWGLSQDVLKRTLFPVGKIPKTETRKILSDAGYDAFSKKGESYEVCFIPDNDYRGFLSRKREIIGGNFIDTAGKIIGTHDGTPFFTIGQRKGLGISTGNAMYVVNINSGTNEIMLGSEDDLMQTSMIVNNINLMKISSITNGMNAIVKIRYRDAGSLAKLYPNDDGSIKVEFYNKVKAITPGQSAVFYDADSPDDLLGGGHILNILK